MIRHLIYIVLSCGLFAQTTGKISGLIKDKSDSSPLPGANVYIENSSFGTASDENGRFTLINIPPGKYNLKIDMIGYKSMKMENILRSEKRVFVTKINAAPGDNLAVDDVIMEFGESAEPVA